MKILKLEMLLNEDNFKPEVKVEVLFDIQELQDNYVSMSREELAEWFLSGYETARNEYLMEQSK